LSFEIIDKKLNGLILLQPRIFEDNRGIFFEAFRKDLLTEVGVDEHFVQDNQSTSQKNVIRGLHFQWNQPLGKLISVVRGEALFVELDIRKNSPTFGQHSTFLLDDKNHNLLWVPFGFANGFCSKEDNTVVNYKCTAYWNPKCEAGILWDDKELNIDWQLNNEDKLIISEKDKLNYTFEEWQGREESGRVL